MGILAFFLGAGAGWGISLVLWLGFSHGLLSGLVCGVLGGMVVMFAVLGIWTLLDLAGSQNRRGKPSAEHGGDGGFPSSPWQ